MSAGRDQVRPLASCVLPAYNEAGVVGVSIPLIAATLGEHVGDYDWEIVVVDDGSTDSTAEEVVSIAPDSLGPRCVVRLVRHRVNAGLGGALRTGFAASRGAVVVAMDTDLSYSPAVGVELVRAWEQTGAHVVIASPYMPGGSTVGVPRTLERRSRVANRLLSVTALDDVKTLTGMVRAYDGPFLRALALKAADVDVNVEIVYKTQLLRGTIVEIPATLDWSGLEQRQARSRLMSKRSRWNTAKSLVMSYLFRPFWFPLAPALLFVPAGLVLSPWLGLRGASIVLLVVGSVMGVFALSMLQAKRYFEELFSQVHGLRAVSPLVPPTQPSVELRPLSSTDSTPEVTTERLET